jgi:hypothetical protein
MNSMVILLFRNTRFFIQLKNPHTVGEDEQLGLMINSVIDFLPIKATIVSNRGRLPCMLLCETSPSQYKHVSCCFSDDHF